MTTKPPKQFDSPVAIRLETGTLRIGTVEAATEMLASMDWPGERGPRHRDAYETCLKALDGHRTAANARAEFLEALREANIPVEV